VNYTYTDAFYGSFPGCTSSGVNCTGDLVPGIPANDVKVMAQYRWDLGDSGSLTAHLDDEWSTKMQVNTVNSADQVGVLHTSKNGFLNGSLTYRPANGNWKIQLWGKNLTNQWMMSAPSNYYFYFVSFAEYLAGDRFVERGVVTPPREVGATVSYTF
jgi:iron complex outermembrane receptor protein